MHSKGKYTPFEGLELNARVMRTFLRGELLVDLSQDFQTFVPTGQFLARSK
jgi:dihydroorotase-like cyclic amidohydrolase